MRYLKALCCYSNWSKRTFQIHEDPHELYKESGKENMWWKEKPFMLLYGENEGG